MLSRLKTYFLTGLLVLAPLTITAYVLWRLFIFMDHLVGTTLRGGYIRPGGIPGVGFVTVIILITVTGALANNFLGRQLGQVLESMLLRVPFLRGLYSTLKEMGEAILSERRQAFQRVVLVPYPSPGIYTIGLVTTDAPQALQDAAGKPLRGVFIPTPPNPTTGPLAYYADEDLIPTSLRVDQAIKMVISGGVVVPADLAVARSARAAAAPEE
ncbi:MAG TPA: DUF502 domain-containing protein [Candidatus Eisenbacteria bacterium]